MSAALRPRRGLLALALAAILLGACAASGAAYTLNNGGSPLAILIPNGTTFRMDSVNPVAFSGGMLNDTCAASSLDGVVTDNGATGNPITLSFTASAYTSCTYPTLGAFPVPWTFRIAQDGAPWTGSDMMRAFIAYGSGCAYAGSGSMEWGNRAATRPLIELAGGSLLTLSTGCPVSVVPSGIYLLTSVDYVFARELKIS